MTYAVINLLLTIIDIYWWIVIASFIMSWLIAFDVINTRSQAVYTVRRALASLTEPVYEPIRRVLPTIGGLDFSPMIVILALQFLSNAITHSVAFG
ncbi:YggT family protein [Methylocystis heyeri]|uniref:YggT family protein n=1 Tax=Methylocystis heyeri TaxID=391905 RepID=A0A6B8KEH9_9HYPH|nr:YggT family protein [Methylocystis heyeri]QGM44770.1 YggT family protein [Methylocystis heyeri]